MLTRSAVLALCMICAVTLLPAAAEPFIAGISCLEDPSGTQTLEEAIARYESGEFTVLEGERIHLGLRSHDYWFRVELRGGEHPERMVLELSNPRLGRVTLFAPDQSGVYWESSAGVRDPFWNREVNGLSPAFPVRLAGGVSSICYLRVENYGSLHFDLRLWTPSGHNAHASHVLAFALAVAGALLVLVLHNFCIYLHLRQTGYLWIAAFLLAYTFRQMTSSAVANMFLWPDSPLWSQHAMTFTGIATFMLGTLMANQLLRLYEFAPRLAWTNVGIGLVTVAAGLFSLSGSGLALPVMMGGAAIVPVVVTLGAAASIRKGYRAARFFLLSWGLVLAGTVVNNLIGPGLLPANPFTEYCLDFALIIAGVSWTFALTGQIKVRGEEQRRMLETQVRERTSELESVLEAVRTLRGLLPICSCCKKIRDDRGYWQHVETYLQEHTEADFSHGLCPDCAHSHYPQYFRKSNGAGDGADEA